MIKEIKSFWFNYQKKNRKKNMKYEIECLEAVLQSNAQWTSDITTLIKVLEVIDDQVLEEADLKNTSSFSCLTGFKNSNHVLNWIATVRSNIHHGVLLGDETRDIAYNRRVRSLQDIIIDNGKISTTVVGFKQQLLHGLKEMTIEIEAISDNRIKHRERSVINSAARDLFAIIEIIIAWGVTDE